jgi:hypothetical protein
MGWGGLGGFLLQRFNEPHHPKLARPSLRKLTTKDPVLREPKSIPDVGFVEDEMKELEVVASGQIACIP